MTVCTVRFPYKHVNYCILLREARLLFLPGLFFDDARRMIILAAAGSVRRIRKIAPLCQSGFSPPGIKDRSARTEHIIKPVNSPPAAPESLSASVRTAAEIRAAATAMRMESKPYHSSGACAPRIKNAAASKKTTADTIPERAEIPAVFMIFKQIHRLSYIMYEIYCGASENMRAGVRRPLL